MQLTEKPLDPRDGLAAGVSEGCQNWVKDRTSQGCLLSQWRCVFLKSLKKVTGLTGLSTALFPPVPLSLQSSEYNQELPVIMGVKAVFIFRLPGFEQ